MNQMFSLDQECPQHCHNMGFVTPAIGQKLLAGDNSMEAGDKTER